jgi:hypothetical protein
VGTAAGVVTVGGVGVGEGVGEAIGVCVVIGTNVEIGVLVGNGVIVGLGVVVDLGVTVSGGVGVRVTVGLGIGDGCGGTAEVGEPSTGPLMGVNVGVSVTVGLGAGTGVDVGRGVGIGDGVGVAVSRESITSVATDVGKKITMVVGVIVGVGGRGVGVCVNRVGVGNTDVRSTRTTVVGVLKATALCSPAAAAGGPSVGWGSPQATPSAITVTEAPNSNSLRLITSLTLENALVWLDGTA